MINVKGTLAVLTGGGDCPGLNAVLNAVVKAALGHGYQIYGIENGFNGLIRNRMKLLTYDDVSGILPRGGTVLGTTNRDNPFKFAHIEKDGSVTYTDESETIVKNLAKRGIETLIVIGGDGSLAIGAQLSRECGVKVIGVPKTIDNDLPCTERTFGFDTAMAVATEAVDRLLNDNNDLKIKIKNDAAKRLERDIEELDSNAPVAVLFTDAVDNTVQRKAVNRLTESRDTICAVFSSDGDGGYNYILSYPGHDARGISSLLKEKFGARGGGSLEMVQGNIKASEEEISALLRQE